LAYEEAAVDSWRGLKQYRIAGRPGLFYDKFREDGSFVEEPAFASSLYHITCAISELIRATERLA
jgi:mannose-6-phosphate isomerase